MRKALNALGRISLLTGLAFVQLCKASAQSSDGSTRSVHLTDVAPLTSNSTVDNSRYPARLPDWLWKDGPLSVFLDPDESADLDIQIKTAEALGTAGRSHDQDIENDKIARSLGSTFAFRDVVKFAKLEFDHSTGRRMAVIIDPKFPENMQNVIKEAIPIYLRYALDDKVITQAFNESVERAEPFPEPTITVDGKTVSNPLYINYLQSVSKPPSINQFNKQLSGVLSEGESGPPLLIISWYKGNSWWGGAYYDFYYKNKMQLQKLRPEGFLYIRLNADRMTPSSPHVYEPAFWASKIAHEVLHNLGYWQPNYPNPEERDRWQQGSGKSFLVSYETHMYESLSVNFTLDYRAF